ncbi:hypothetical protein [Streptomyces sp. NPDC001292]|uniref:hypothetical protein n=1 Tax=Streptomyces sp. NPDC001292 TaxID=3364558 RepID=UPI003696A358
MGAGARAPGAGTAARCGDFGEPLVIEERPDPESGPGQVRVRVEACGPCHTDEVLRGQVKARIVCDLGEGG